jgi:general secretion pathway protein G
MTAKKRSFDFAQDDRKEDILCILNKDMRLNFPTHRRRGFTLIELLVVLTVIGILATLIIANFSSARARARDIRRKSDLQALKTALRLYYNDNQRYPAASGSQIGCCAFGASFTVSGQEYMKQIPLDPLNASPYVYSYQYVSSDSFRLTARLENVSDADDTASQLRCGVAAGAVVNNLYMICED